MKGHLRDGRHVSVHTGERGLLRVQWVQGWVGAKAEGGAVTTEILPLGQLEGLDLGHVYSLACGSDSLPLPAG